jgi:HEAT repeat protein
VTREQDFRILNDPRSDEGDVIEAAKRLIELEGDRTRVALEESLASAESENGRKMAAWALGFLGDPEAARALVEKLADDTEHEEVRCYAAEAIGHLLQGAPRDALVVAALGRALEDSSPAIRFWTLFAFGNIGSAADIATLEAHLEDDREIPGWQTVGSEAAWAIEQIRAREGPEVEHPGAE